MKIKNYINHFLTIVKHKYYVFLSCRDFGITWRGIKHDMSKFSPTEFFEYADNFEEGRSPVLVCKERYGYSKSWLHHRGHNDHHYEYWIDSLSSGGVALKMPYENVVEFIADQIGASKTYLGKNWTQKSNYEFFIKDKMKLHSQTRHFIEIAYRVLKNYGYDNLKIFITSDTARNFYNQKEK